MRKQLLHLFFIFSFILVFICPKGYTLPIPPLKGRVVDLANVLTPSQKMRIETRLREFELQTSNQIAVLILPTLGDENLEDYSIRVVEEWKLGQSGKDNGVLLLIAMQERKVRIEVGYGLEGALTDFMAATIIRNEIAPAFRQGAYATGISKAVNAIIQVTAGEYKAESRKGRETGSGGLGNLLAHLFLLFFLLPFLGFGRRRGWGWAGFGAGYWLGSYGRNRGGGFPGGFGGFSGGGGGFGGGGASGGW